MAENFGLLTKNDFWIEDPRLGVLLKNCLFFGRFQPGVAYKSVAYKKKACKQNHGDSILEHGV